MSTRCRLEAVRAKHGAALQRPPLRRVQSVARRLPPRSRSSVRRTSSLEVLPQTSWDQGLLVNGSASDTAADAAGLISELSASRLTLKLDSRSAVTEVRGDLAQPVVAGVIGKQAISGFRARLTELQADRLDQDSLSAALLDDLPTVRLISGYARMMESPLPPGPRLAPSLSICRGWAPDGTAQARAGAGLELLDGVPTAPAFVDLLDATTDFHDESPLQPRSMRRRRILEVVPRNDTLEVYEYFRDSHIDADGVEGSLHEYVVTAVVNAADLVVMRISVEPLALPFAECPLAAGNAELLCGSSLSDINASVKSLLNGTMGCTHLNDVLRFLRFVGPLHSSLLTSEV
jgi:hypothetical protein